MKYLLLTASLLASPAIAGDLSEQGLDDPEVTAPARAAPGDWTGLYVGLNYGRSTTETTETRCFKLGMPKACDDPIFDYYPEYKVIETTTTKTASDDVGAFAGYRHDFGRIVGGVEIGAIGDLTSAEAQVGVDLGRVLVYGLAGGAKRGDETGSIYGAGLDVRVGKRAMVGVKHTTGDVGDLTTLRVGIRF